MTPIRTLSNQILKAETVEEIFGELSPPNEDNLKAAARKLQLLVHPDHNKEKDADAVFNALSKLVELATKAITEGVYGKNAKIKVTKIISKKNEYALSIRSFTGENTNIFNGVDKDGTPIKLKLAKDVSCNKAVLHTVKMLTRLAAATDEYPAVPRLVDNFTMQVDGKKLEALVYTDPELGKLPNLTLTKVINHYPKGVQPAHMIWMMKRVLGAILQMETAKIVHGAILPCHIVVYPDSHIEKVIGWSHAVDVGQKGKQIIEKFKDYYPIDYLTNKHNSFTDIFMLAKCMIKVLGGNIVTNEMPDSVPFIMQGFLRALVVGNNYTDATTVFNNLVNLADQIFGPPKFIQLNIPKT